MVKKKNSQKCLGCFKGTSDHLTSNQTNACIEYICNYKNICYNIIAQNDQGMKLPFVVVLIKISVSDGQRFNILSVLGVSLCQPLQTTHI